MAFVRYALIMHLRPERWLYIVGMFLSIGERQKRYDA